MAGLEGIPNLETQVATAMQPMQDGQAKATTDTLQKNLNGDGQDLGAKDAETRTKNLVAVAGSDGAAVVAKWFDDQQISNKRGLHDAVIKNVEAALHDPEKQKEMLAAAHGMLNTAQLGNAEESLQRVFSGDPRAKEFEANFANIVQQEAQHAFIDSKGPPAQEQTKAPPAKASQQR